MLLRVCKDKVALRRTAAGQAATAIRRAIAERGGARIVAATAASELEFLNALSPAADIDWPKVEAFHLDEASLLSSAFERALTEESQGLAGS
jgi:glucosamine-6-phosphate deaminase